MVVLLGGAGKGVYIENYAEANPGRSINYGTGGGGGSLAQSGSGPFETGGSGTSWCGGYGAQTHGAGRAPGGGLVFIWCKDSIGSGSINCKGLQGYLGYSGAFQGGSRWWRCCFSCM